jgi:hypothetical protein
MARQPVTHHSNRLVAAADSETEISNAPDSVDGECARQRVAGRYSDVGPGAMPGFGAHRALPLLSALAPHMAHLL